MSITTILKRAKAQPEPQRDARRLDRERQQERSHHLVDLKARLATLESDHADALAKLPSLSREYRVRVDELEGWKLANLNPLLMLESQLPLHMAQVTGRIAEIEREAEADERALQRLLAAPPSPESLDLRLEELERRTTAPAKG